jgi:hypothetical protein
MNFVGVWKDVSSFLLASEIDDRIPVKIARPRFPTPSNVRNYYSVCLNPNCGIYIPQPSIASVFSPEPGVEVFAAIGQVYCSSQLVSHEKVIRFPVCYRSRMETVRINTDGERRRAGKLPGGESCHPTLFCPSNFLHRLCLDTCDCSYRIQH